MRRYATSTNKHGTKTMVRRGKACWPRCAACTAVLRALSSGQDRDTGELLCECWCRRDALLVTKANVAAGVTRSCGRKGCAP